MSALKKSIAAVGLAAAAMSSQAAVTQLGFILDSSGSIGSTNWNTIVNGLANAVGSLIPANGTYEISVVTFASTATLNINSFLVNNTTTRTTLANQIRSLTYIGSNTNYAAAFSLMQTALTDNIGQNYGTAPVTTTATAAASYVNFGTDGAPNVGGNGIAERNALIAAGVDNISIEGIGGGVNPAVLQSSYCYPTPCDSTAPYDFPNKGFYIPVATAAQYEAAIANKIRIVTGQTPEPGALALVGLGLLGMVAARRRKAA